MVTAPARCRKATEQPRPPDPQESAQEASLRYVTDSEPGIRRTRRGRGFSYVGPDGKPVRDESTLARIRALAIPPAWTDVWICGTSRGHVQATGRDNKGRKQYRYHPRWSEARDEAKYERLIEFGESLPAIRARTSADLATRGMPREKVLAAVVRLLEGTLIRVGNEEYARANGSFGLTTMRDRHVSVEGSEIQFEFTGKHGKRHVVGVRDKRLARVVQRSRDLPGQTLFQYVDDDGVRHPVTSDDVNAYLREITGREFTAKDFRTWAGTVLAAWALEEFGEFDSEADGRRNVVAAIESVSRDLGNTPTICRTCYVHPDVIDAYLDGMLLETLRERAEARLTGDLAELEPEEAAVLALLRQRLAAQSD